MALILIVDDDEMNRELTQTIMKRAGYEVITAVNGTRALAAIATQPPDMMLLDVRMADMTGYEVCAQVKGNPATQHIPVIILTAHENEVERRNAMDAGADDFLSKMAGWQKLVERVRSFVPA